MIQKMFDSTRSGNTKFSSHVASVYDNDFLELVWENGEVVVRGSSSNRTKKSNEEKTHEDGSITKRTRFNTLYSLEDNFPPQRDSDMNSSHQSYGQDSCQSSQSKNSCKLHEEFANLLKPVKDYKPVITTGNTHSQQQQQQCLPSSPLKKQKTDSTQTPPGAINTRNSGLDQRTTKVNFSNFSIPAVFLKTTTCQGNSATHQTKNDAPSQARVVEEIKSAKESHGFQKQTSLAVERSTKPPSPVDEHSEIVGRNISSHRSQSQQRCCDQNLSSEAVRAKSKANTNMCHDPLIASSSVCSLGASNDPNFGIRKHEDTDDSTYLSDNDGEPEDIEKQTTEREGNRVKRSRNAVVHNLSEKKRREKINKRMRTLKELIPNCNKLDKASMLDDAIDYLKTLKLQLQIMSMGTGLWPLMMLPAAAAHHMNGPHLPQLVGGMGFRPPPQLPIPPLSAMTDSRLNMFGFPNQIPPMPMPHAPFFPIIPNSATQPHLPTTTTPTTNNMVEHFSKLLPKNLDPHEDAATKQVPNQVVFQHHNTSCTLPLANSTFIFPQK